MVAETVWRKWGQSVRDEGYEDISVTALSAEYEGVRTASCKKHNLHSSDIRDITSTMYTDFLPARTPHTRSQAAGLPCRQVTEVMAAKGTI